MKVFYGILVFVLLQSCYGCSQHVEKIHEDLTEENIELSDESQEASGKDNDTVTFLSEIDNQFEIDPQIKDYNPMSLCDCDLEAFYTGDFIMIGPEPHDTAWPSKWVKIDLNPSGEHHNGAFFMHIYKYDEGRFQVDKIKVGWRGKELTKYKDWWVYTVHTSGPPNDYKYNVYSDTLKTDVIDYTYASEFDIFECRGTWIYVRPFKGYDNTGKLIEGKTGWLPKDILCPNPFTSCTELNWERHVYKGNTVQDE